MTTPTIDYQQRQRDLLRATGQDAVALVPGANLVYFTGLHYHLSERPILVFITAEGLIVLVPQLELGKLQQRADLPAQPFVWTDSEGYEQTLRDMIEQSPLSRYKVGVDGQTMRVFEWLALDSAGLDTKKATNVAQKLLQIRAIKTPIEVASIQNAIQLSETALERTIAQARPGMTERQIAQILADELNAAGSEGFAFHPLVLTGEKSALPHGNTGDRTLQADEFLLIDFGGMKGGYPADITRTFCLGTPSDEMRAIYDAVYRANAAAREAARPGVTCGDVDRAARQVIEEAGYGEYFTHRTGHGLGLEVHELPQIANGVDEVLAPGMVFTIEPGIYIPSIGGVRIEDNILITADGAQSLTQYPRQL